MSANPILAIRRHITLSVPQVVFDRLGEMAKAVGMSRADYAQMLFDAAYATRCKDTGDVELEAACSAVVLLWGNGFDTHKIALALKLDEPVVQRMLDCFRRVRDAA